jgi:hypothetical protein
MSTIEVKDRSAREIEQQAKILGMSVAELIEVMADQFIAAQGQAFDLTDEQMEEIHASIEDPAPSIPHEQVMTEARRIVAGRK